MGEVNGEREGYMGLVKREEKYGWLERWEIRERVVVSGD